MAVAASLIFCCTTAAHAQVSLDSELRAVSSANQLPALAAAVMLKGRLVAAGSAGTRRAGADIAVTRNDRFHLGSDTKAMTALLAAMLIESGKLKWDSTLADVFPELAATMTADLRRVTVTQLMSHSSGLPADNEAFIELLAKAGTQVGNLDQQRYWMLQQIATRPLEAKPGSRFAYSNLGYVVLGTVLEKLSGKTWEELIVERIFTPLNLKTAGIGPQASIGRVDAPLGHNMVGSQPIAVPSGPAADNPAILGPAGTAHMSVLDFARWGSWVAGEGKRPPFLVKPDTMRKLTTPVISMAMESTAATTVSGASKYAMGWAIVNVPWAPAPLVFHGGSNGMNKAHIWIDAANDAAIVVVTNIATQTAEDAMVQFAGKLYPRHVKAVAPKK